MSSTFLSAFQPTFVADCVHHDLAFCSEEVGGQNEPNGNQRQEPGFQPKRAMLQFQAVEGDRRHKQSGYQQHDAGIAKTVKGLEELHSGLPDLRIENSYGARRVEGQDQMMVERNISSFALIGTTAPTGSGLNNMNPAEQLFLQAGELDLKTQNRVLYSAPVM